MHFVDTHIHLNDFTNGADEIIAEAFACGIDKMINMSSTPQEWQKVLELSRKYPKNVVSALGMHPWYVNQITESDFDKLEKLLKSNRDVLLGECGLDGLKPHFTKQTEVFLRQTELAKKYNRPMVIHCVKAIEWFQNNRHELPERFVFHSYNGKVEFLKQILNYGGYVGLNASVFKSSAVAEIIKYVPADRIVLETDAPYQGFEKGKENKPEAILEIFEKIARIRDEDKEALAHQIYQNSLNLIHL